MGTVYFIGSADADAPVKVGYTENLARRLRSLQTGVPFRLGVLAQINGNLSTERRFHDKHAISRISGEWFVRSEAILRDIDQINAGTFNVGELDGDQDREDLERAKAMVAEGRALRIRVQARIRKRRQRERGDG